MVAKLATISGSHTFQQGWKFAHLLWSLMINQRMTNISFFLSESLIRSFVHKKFWLKSFFLYVFLKKRAIYSFPLFYWAIRSGRSPKMSEWSNWAFFWANGSFAHFFAKNERFAQKTSDSLRLLTKNERMIKLSVFWADCSFAHFFRKKLAIRSENRSANYCISGSTSYRKNFYFILA